MAGTTGRPGRDRCGPRRAAGRAFAATLAALSLELASCSDRDGAGQGPDRRAGSVPDEGSFFVDRDDLAIRCVSSGITYPIKTEERTIDGSDPTPADATAVRLARAVVEETFGPYARRFFDKIGLRKIVLCRGLKVDGVAGVAFADVERGTLFVAIDSGTPDAALGRSLHHEVFHFVDFADDGRLDADPAWSALNPPSFSYGTGGASMQGDFDAGRPDDALAGFVDRYATSGLAEDKAEVYALLMVARPWMLRRAAEDPALGGKVERVRAALARHGALAPDISSMPR